jgi:hypothetical protein
MKQFLLATCLTLSLVYAVPVGEPSALAPNDIDGVSEHFGNLTMDDNDVQALGRKKKKCKVTTVGGGCSAFKKCCDGLSCQPGKFFLATASAPCSSLTHCSLRSLDASPLSPRSPLLAGKQKCYHKPRWLHEPCVAGHPCSDSTSEGSLSCHPGIHKCYHHPRQVGEPCSAGFGCGKEGASTPLECWGFKCHREERRPGDACTAQDRDGGWLDDCGGLHYREQEYQGKLMIYPNMLARLGLTADDPPGKYTNQCDCYAPCLSFGQSSGYCYRKDMNTAADDHDGYYSTRCTIANSIVTAPPPSAISHDYSEVKTCYMLSEATCGSRALGRVEACPESCASGDTVCEAAVATSACQAVCEAYHDNQAKKVAK